MACILIADDETDILKVRALLLKMEGHEILTANNGAEALQLALVNSVDLIITDWMMPTMDGITLCKMLKGNAATQNIPVILSSGVDFTPEGVGVLYDAFLPKLSSIYELTPLIEELLENSRKNQP